MPGDKHHELTGNFYDSKQAPEAEGNIIQPGDGNWFAAGIEGGAAAVVSPQFQRDVDRYRQLGARSPAAIPQVDTTASNESRGLQMGALGMLRRQADGSAPSAAEVLSQRANQGATRMAASAATGARTVGGGLAAFSASAPGAAQQAMAANAANAGQRAAEVSRGQAQYAGGNNAVRVQDLGIATQNAQLEQQHRAATEQRQQAFERMAFDTRNTETQAANEARNQDNLGAQQERAARLQERQADWQKTKDVASMGMAAFSDPRTKTNVVPMGSLASLMRRGRS